MGMMLYGLKQKMMLELQRAYVTLELPLILEAPMIAMERIIYERDLDQIPIEQPIFIIGCHRSGTTALYDLLAKHPDIAYFTNASTLLPRSSIMTHQFGKMMGLQGVELERFFGDGVGYTYDSPSEGIRVWERYTTDQETHCLDENYDNPQMENYLKTMIRKHLRVFNRSRFLNKNPDNSVRTRYIHKIFPDARYIHVIRDGRAVTASLVRAKQRAIEFFGWGHPHAEHGTIVEGWPQIKKIWEQEDPVVGAGLLWKAVMETLERDVKVIPPEQLLEIRYEDLLAAPQDSINRILELCQLRIDPEVMESLQGDIDKMSARQDKQGWKQAFSEDDLERLMEAIGPTMIKLGYRA